MAPLGPEAYFPPYKIPPHGAGSVAEGEVLQLNEFPAEPDVFKESAVRFFEGKLDGNQATLVIYAHRDYLGTGAIAILPRRVSRPPTHDRFASYLQQ
jgi:hypothetical protein